MDFEDLFAQANRFKEGLAQAKNLLDRKTVEVTGGRGTIVVVINGSGIIKDIRLSPDAINSLGQGGLQSALVETVNKAYERSRELAAGIMSDVTGFDLSNFSKMF